MLQKSPFFNFFLFDFALENQGGRFVCFRQLRRRCRCAGDEKTNRQAGSAEEEGRGGWGGRGVLCSGGAEVIVVMECGRYGGAGGQGLSSGGGVGSREIISLFEVSTTPPPDPPPGPHPPGTPQGRRYGRFPNMPSGTPSPGGGVPEPGCRTQITSSRVELVLKWCVKSQLQAWEN